MGDRVSIQFQNGEGKSAIMYSHWGGLGIPGLATEYVRRLKADKVTGDGCGPLSALQPDAVMFNFVWWLQKQIKWAEPTDLYCTQGAWELTVHENEENRGHRIVRCDLRREYVYFVVDAVGRAFEVVGARSLRDVIERVEEQYYVMLRLSSVKRPYPVSWDFGIYRVPSSYVVDYSDGDLKLNEVLRNGAVQITFMLSGTFHVARHDTHHSSRCDACGVWGYEGRECPQCGCERDTYADCDCNDEDCEVRLAAARARARLWASRLPCPKPAAKSRRKARRNTPVEAAAV